MKPSIRLHIEHIRETGGRQTLHLDFKDIPVGMTPIKCVRWMLSRAQERFQQESQHPPARVD